MIIKRIIHDISVQLQDHPIKRVVPFRRKLSSWLRSGWEDYDHWKDRVMAYYRWDKPTWRKVYETAESEDQYYSKSDSCFWDIPESYRGHVIDLGCGPGRMELQACHAAGFILGIDFSLSMLELARKVVSRDKRNIAFIQNDGETIPVGNQKVDAVFADALFLHIPRQVTLSYFDEIARVLGPGGYFLSKVKRAGYYPHLLAVSTQFTETELNHILSVRFQTVEIAPNGDEFSVKCRTNTKRQTGHANSWI